MKTKIISIRENPDFAERGADYFASKWNISRAIYLDSIEDGIQTVRTLPRWYLLLDGEERIIGGFGLILNDFVDRVDLFPYLCALFVEPHARGQALGSRMLEHARIEAAALGFKKIYLCTDHIGYYEKYGWRHIGTGSHPWGETSRIYEADTMDSNARQT